MKLTNYIGCKVKILLVNNYYYIGKVISADENSLDLLDIKGHLQSQQFRRFLMAINILVIDSWRILSDKHNFILAREDKSIKSLEARLSKALQPLNLRVVGVDKEAKK